MLEDTLKSYKYLAEKINWKSYNCNDLFYEYIKHENETIGQCYYAGIVCRYWGYAARVYNQCNKHVPFEQCYDILIDTINYVLNKRVWENPESSLYGDHTAADKAFHIALKRQRGIVLSNLSAAKRQANFNTVSIENLFEDYSDAAEGLFNMVDDCEPNDIIEVDLLHVIKSKAPIAKILLDLVCYGDSNNIKNSVTKAKKLSLDDFKYYSSRYNISETDFKKCLVEFKLKSASKLLSELKRELYLMRKEYV